MADLIKIDCTPKPPDGLVEDLREIADKVKDGKITSVVIGFIEEGEYRTLYASSLVESITLSSLLLHTTIHKFGGV